MTAADKLRSARALIADYENWCQGDYGKDGWGRSIDPYAVGCVKRCAHGARFAAEVSDYGVRILSNAARFEGRSTLISVNDSFSPDPRECHAAVLRVYDRAIELAEAAA